MHSISPSRRPIAWLVRRPVRRGLIVVSSLGVVLTAAGILLYLLSPGGPSYATLLPDGKQIEQLGGWQRVSPPNGEAVFAYIDTIDGVTVTVSQQPLPAAFVSDTQRHIEELAREYNATKQIKAASTTLHIGTSAKGPQSVIFTRDNLLVLVKSSGIISDDAWKHYADSLTRR